MPHDFCNKLGTSVPHTRNHCLTGYVQIDDRYYGHSSLQLNQNKGTLKLRGHLLFRRKNGAFVASSPVPMMPSTKSVIPCNDGSPLKKFVIYNCFETIGTWSVSTHPDMSSLIERSPQI